MQPGYRDLLLAFRRSEPVCSFKAARDLTPAEARDMVVYFVATGQLTLDRQLAFNESGQLTYPAAGQKVYLQPPMVAGVPFVIVNPNTGLPSSMVARAGALDLMFVVLLQRLAVMLKRDWHAAQIYYGGFGAGGGQCHKDGRAIDFYGAQTQNHGQFLVEREWWLTPILLPNGQEVSGNSSRMGHFGKRGTEWPTGVAVKYRLETGPNQVARAFFKDVWDFASEQARPGGFICHPDHSSPSLRADHWNHMHFQIGST
jgi:hypothetical protein